MDGQGIIATLEALLYSYCGQIAIMMVLKYLSVFL